jgi:cell division protein FtsX
MKSGFSADRWLALFFLAFALLVIFVWAPLDTGTGLVEKVRRKFVIGDALGPTVAGAVVVIGALLLLLRPGTDKMISAENVTWIAALLSLFTISMLLMRYAGPVALAWSESGYRPLRATAPWHYIGFLIGGAVLVGGLTGLAKRRLSIRDFAIGFVASLVIALLYDLPFDDLILPPNGDV